ncbi:MAG TPA: VOC family protein [Anaerolineales bacterium]|nr:VOC family protein [Anaerolineales bacterium]
MSTNNNFGLSQIDQVALPVEDIDRASAFYQSKLGMKFLFRAGDLVFFDCGGVRLLLSRPEGKETANHASILYFKVPDIHQAYQTLTQRGVDFDDEPHLIADMGDYEIWMAFFRDSEQNVLAISSEVPRNPS